LQRLTPPCAPPRNHAITTHRHRRRDRRRTEATLEQAFAALDRGQRELARKLSLRARTDGGMNVRVLHDHAELMLALGDLDEAEDALRAAIALAPIYVDAFAALAALQAQRGKWPAAARLQQKVVELKPHDERAAASLREYEAAAAAADPAPAEPAGEAPQEIWNLSARARALDVDALRTALIAHGHATAPLLTAAECAELRQTCAADAPGLDRVEIRDAARWRHFLIPPPLPVASLRAALFAPAAALANAQCQQLGDEPRFPDSWSRWRGAAEGRSTSRWVELAARAQTLADRIDDRRAFPLRGVIDLGPGDPAETVAVLDQRPGRKVRASRARSRAGDVVFCSWRERLCAVAGVFGLQLVRYRLGPVPAERQLLDLDFDGR
jgi:hypothetical protein